ncbi:putative aldo-keto reductase [Xylaria sp. FL1777]|nr:putative aldo-keto reductase [Xylaria sp. FL1777]
MSELTISELGFGSGSLRLLYGTAWKEERTADLTEEALNKGFRGVDSANYPTAYDEPLIGEGIARALASGLKRKDLFIQSKYCPTWAHDPDKIPFDEHKDIHGQIVESVHQTLDNLKVDCLDALILHIPFEKEEDNFIAWKTLESFVPTKARLLGCSNFGAPLLEKLINTANIKPVIVQNPFIRANAFDVDVRALCKKHGLVYQSFSALKNNDDILNSEVVAALAGKLKVEKALAVYLLVLSLGNLQILDGTTKAGRMENDLKVVDSVLNDAQLVEDLKPFSEDFEKLLEKISQEETKNSEGEEGESKAEP